MSTPESRVRDPVVKWAKEKGIGHVRMSFRPGVRQGVPDDLFLIPGGRAVWIEFKRPGKLPTPLQQHRLNQIRDLGFDAEWFSNAEVARAWLRSRLED